MVLRGDGGGKREACWSCWGGWMLDLSFRDPDRASKDGAWASLHEGDGQRKEEEVV